VRMFLLILVFVQGGVGVATASGENVKSKNFASTELGISFAYPEAWGDVDVVDYRSDAGSRAYRLKGDGMDWVLQFSSPPMPCNVVLRIGEFLPAKQNRVVCYEGYCDTFDILELQSEVLQAANRMVMGTLALTRDFYFEPGGAAQRITTWFVGGVLYELTESVRVHDIANKSFSGGRRFGVARLLEENPADRRLTSFASAVEALLNSFKRLD